MSMFSQNLKALRLERGVTQPQLADAVGVSNGMISLWENGKCEPTAGNLINLAKYFEVSVDDLLGVDE